MNALILSPAGWLAQDPAPGPQGPEFGGSSPIGLVVILLLLIAVVLLVRSMTKHLKKVPESFDKPTGTEADDGAGTEAGTGTETDDKAGTPGADKAGTAGAAAQPAGSDPAAERPPPKQ